MERFDRVIGPNGQPVALAVEDGAQVMDLYPSDKYRVSAEEMVAALSDACAARALAASPCLPSRTPPVSRHAQHSEHFRKR